MDKKGAKSGRKKGRPSKLDTINLDSMMFLYEKGFTDEEVGLVLNVSEVSINRYKNSKAFLKALKKGKSIADAKVEKSLFERAIGFEVEEVTYETDNSVGVIGESELCVNSENELIERAKINPKTKIKVVKKKILGDTTAQIFWLKNRQPERWRDKHEIEQSGDILITYDNGDRSEPGNPLRKMR